MKESASLQKKLLQHTFGHSQLIAYTPKDYKLILTGYAENNPKISHFIHSLHIKLTSIGVRISTRDYLICIMLYENKLSDLEISRTLGIFNYATFRTVKSQLKSQLLKVDSSDQTFIHLMERLKKTKNNID